MFRKAPFLCAMHEFSGFKSKINRSEKVSAMENVCNGGPHPQLNPGYAAFHLQKIKFLHSSNCAGLLPGVIMS